MIFYSHEMLLTQSCLLKNLSLKMSLQILVRKFYKITKKSSQSLLTFIHRTTVVERHPITKEIRDFTTAQVDTNGKHGLLLHEQHVDLHTENTQTKLQT